MRLSQLLENKDYALAKKLWDQLDHNAQRLIRSWEYANWHEGGLTGEFESNSDLAQHIMKVGQPIRDQIRAREGDLITLYRGLGADATPERFRPSRVLYSWTSSEKIAQHFAGKQGRPKFKLITDKEIQDALARYEKTGFTTFRGRKYKINKDAPQYYDIYDQWNNIITDGDNLEREFRSIQEYYQEFYNSRTQIDGRMVKKEIPVNDIVWVLMGGNANEYIIKGHPE